MDLMRGSDPRARRLDKRDITAIFHTPRGET